jgi:hypothetical protein
MSRSCFAGQSQNAGEGLRCGGKHNFYHFGRGQRLSAGSIHAGTSNGLTPRIWSDYDRGGFDAAQRSFVEFSHQCFSRLLSCFLTIALIYCPSSGGGMPCVEPRRKADGARRQRQDKPQGRLCGNARNNPPSPSPSAADIRAADDPNHNLDNGGAVAREGKTCAGAGGVEPAGWTRAAAPGERGRAAAKLRRHLAAVLRRVRG